MHWGRRLAACFGLSLACHDTSPAPSQCAAPQSHPNPQHTGRVRRVDPWTRSDTWQPCSHRDACAARCTSGSCGPAHAPVRMCSSVWPASMLTHRRTPRDTARKEYEMVSRGTKMKAMGQGVPPAWDTQNGYELVMSWLGWLLAQVVVGGERDGCLHAQTVQSKEVQPRMPHLQPAIPTWMHVPAQALK